MALTPIPNIEVGSVVHVAVVVLREVACVSISNDEKTADVAEFEVTDKHSRARVLATTEKLIAKLRESRGQQCLLLNVTSRIVPTKPGEGHLRLLLTEPTCAVPYPCDPDEEEHLTESYLLQHGLLPHLLRTADSLLPSSPFSVSDDRSFECYDIKRSKKGQNDVFGPDEAQDDEKETEDSEKETPKKELSGANLVVSHLTDKVSETRRLSIASGTRRKASIQPNVPSDMLGEQVTKMKVINSQIKELEAQGSGYHDKVNDAIEELRDLSVTIETKSSSSYMDEVQAKVVENAKTLDKLTMQYSAKEKQLTLVLGREDAMCGKLRRRIEELQLKIAELTEAAALSNVKQTELDKQIKKVVHGEELSIKQMKFKLLKEFHSVAFKSPTAQDKPGLTAIQQWVTKKYDTEEEVTNEKTSGDEEVATAAQMDKLKRQIDRQKQEVDEARNAVKSKEAHIRTMKEEVARLTAMKQGVGPSEMRKLRTAVKRLNEKQKDVRIKVRAQMNAMNNMLQKNEVKLMEAFKIFEKKICEGEEKLERVTEDLENSEKKGQVLLEVLEACPEGMRKITSTFDLNAHNTPLPPGSPSSPIRMSGITDCKISQQLEALNQELLAVDELATNHKKVIESVTVLKMEVKGFEKNITKLEKKVALQDEQLEETQQMVGSLETQLGSAQGKLATTEAKLVEAREDVVKKEKELSVVVANNKKKEIKETTVSMPATITTASVAKVRKICADINYQAEKLSNPREVRWICKKIDEVEAQAENASVHAETVFGELDFLQEFVQFLNQRPTQSDEPLEERQMRRVREQIDIRKRRWLMYLSSIHFERKTALQKLQRLIATEKEASQRVGRSVSFMRWLDQKMECVKDAMTEIVEIENGLSENAVERLPVWMKYKPNTVQTWVPRRESSPSHEESDFMMSDATCDHRIRAADRIVFEKKVYRRLTQRASLAEIIPPTEQPTCETLPPVNNSLSQSSSAVQQQQPSRIETPYIRVSQGNNQLKVGTVDLSLPDDINHAGQTTRNYCVPAAKPSSPPRGPVTAPPTFKVTHLPTIELSTRVECSDTALEKVEAIVSSYKAKRRDSMLKNRGQKPSKDLTPNCVNTKTSLNTAPAPSAATCFTLC